MTKEGLKINQRTIMNYMNAPLMVIFGGTKENIVKFIISRYHNGKFYFDEPVEISIETIYKLTGLSSKGDPIPIGVKEGVAAATVLPKSIKFWAPPHDGILLQVVLSLIVDHVVSFRYF